jgi:hypothetical protein
MGWRPCRAATSCGHKGRARLDALRNGLASREASQARCDCPLLRTVGCCASCGGPYDQAQRLCLTVPETSADQLVMRLAVWLGLCAFTGA